MNRAFKFRIYPTSSQQELISKTFGCVRFVHNRMLGEKIEYYNTRGQSLKVTPAKYKREFEFLKEVDSLALANVQLNLEVAYRNFFRNKSFGFPKYKSKKNERKSYTTNLVNGNIRIDGGMLILPKLGKIRIKQHRRIPEDYRLKSATVSQSASGKYHVAILYEYDCIVKPKPIENIVGLDFSMKELYISSEDTKPNYPGYYRQSLQKLAHLQRALSKMTKYSNNYRKHRLKVAILHEHIANQRKDFLHKQSRQITNAYDCVAIEDLNMKGMSQALNFGKSVSDNGWGMFVSFLDYKLREEGKALIRVDKWFPSSKTCSVCGAIKKELSMSERIYQCDCGNILDRDVNAAINIKNEALRLLSVA